MIGKNNAREEIRECFIDFTAGCIGGTAMILAGQPLDTLKVKMQTSPALNHDMTTTFERILKNEGFRKGLYAGTSPAIMANVAEMSFMMMTFAKGQKIIMEMRGKISINDLSTFENSLAGGFSGLFSSFAVCPIEHIKCRVQTFAETNKNANTMKNNNNVLNVNTPKRPINVGERKSTFQLAKIITKEDGFLNLYRGIFPTLCREIPGCFFFFLGNEGTKTILCQILSAQEKRTVQKSDLGFKSFMFSGGMAGVCFWMFMFPIDLVKSKVQVSAQENLSVSKVISEIYQSYGLKGFFSGFKPCILRAFPTSAIMFVVYEYTKKVLSAL